MHRRLVVLGDVEGLDGDPEGVGHADRGQHRADGVAMRGEGGGKQVRLLALGRHAGGRSAALHVDADEGQFGHAGQTEQLGLEGEPRAGGGGHGLGSGKGSAHGRADAGDFILGLQQRAALLPNLLGKCSMISVAGVMG